RQIEDMIWGKPLTQVWPDQKDLVTYYAAIFNGNDRNITNNDNNEFMYMGQARAARFRGQTDGAGSESKGRRRLLLQPGRNRHEHLALYEFAGKCRWVVDAVHFAKSRRAPGVECRRVA